MSGLLSAILKKKSAPTSPLLRRDRKQHLRRGLRVLQHRNRHMPAIGTGITAPPFPGRALGNGKHLHDMFQAREIRTDVRLPPGRELPVDLVRIKNRRCYWIRCGLMSGLKSCSAAGIRCATIGVANHSNDRRMIATTRHAAPQERNGMDSETEIAVAQVAGQISALKQIVTTMLSRYAAEFGEGAEEFIMTTTAPLTASTVDDEGDPASRAAIEAFVQMAEDVETHALDRLVD